MLFVASILSTVFTGPAALHLYWAGGGTWAASAALPQHQDGRAVFQPGAAACVVVALGLAAFAYTCLAHGGIVPQLFLANRTRVILLVISGVFALRTIGDFKFVGLFRRVHPTDFSRRDRAFYTPLCFVLSALLAWLALGSETAGGPDAPSINTVTSRSEILHRYLPPQPETTLPRPRVFPPANPYSKT